MTEADKSQEPNGTGITPATQRRKRSTAFPVVSLSEAAGILKEAGKYGFEHSAAGFASYMGHSTTNSGAFRQRLAAFRDWKLLAGRGESLAMTEIARMIAVPTDDAAERRALQAAFFNSPVFFKLYERSAKGQPLAMGPLGGRAVHDFGVAPGSKDKFVQTFIESAVASGLAERTDDDQFVLHPLKADSAPADEDFPEAQGRGSGSDLVAPKRPQPLPRPSTPPVVHQAWDIDGGTLTFEIRTAKPLPATVFVIVGEVVACLERLATALVPEVVAEMSDEDSED